jgi:flagellar basal body rod protein FlgB
VRSDLSFRETLAEAVSTHDHAALANAQPKRIVDRSSRARADGNNVSSQKELGMMAQNGLLYDVSARALSSKYARELAAIKGQ